MILHFFPHFLTRSRRRWGYALVEAAAIAVFALTAPGSVSGRAYRLGMLDPGMARVTAICFMAVSICLFVMVVCLKQVDQPDRP